MTTNILKVAGSLSVKSAAAGVSSGEALVSMALAAQMTFDEYYYQVIDLAADGVTSIALGALSAVNTLFVQVVGPSGVTLRITTASAATQAVPVDKLLLLTSANVDITALDVQRAAGQATTLYVLLGQRA